ncbi:Crp/Fnr family transcriptional regulator [Flavobacterium sediminilitoris]|uniref:Crp/Fnr family transcriptional regulator n=1 Tax=Flavobacterium sediminilitoris TaxID=2024526 RepID=A0ABY4HQ38_9FLAO|nr:MULTISPECIES: Crp/Fnr family transcriptional regulator [Flavobacterium]UOX34730.1 Crp/Fnr family transcriptional regulator [Flavobacterium sediminilitoris]
MKIKKTTNSLVSYIKLFIDNDIFEKDILNAASLFSNILLNKNNFLVKENDICNYFCFIENGILQHSITVLNEEKTSYLALKNSVTTSLSSFLNKVPSRKSIKAISDCNLWVIDFETFSDLVKNNKGFNQFYSKLIEKQICLIDDYRIDLLTLTPEERYKKLLVNETKLLQEVPLHYLASFLGISTRHMSRIRKNIK